MIQFIDCVYRIDERSEMIAGSFDTVSGEICHAQELLQFNLLEEYEYYTQNYSNFKTLPITKLYELLAVNSKALIAINYNNIGAVLIYRDRHTLFHLGDRQYLKETAFAKKWFPFEVEMAGLIKTKLLMYSVVQPVAYLVVIKQNGKKYAYTAFGKKQIDFNFDSIQSVDFSKYLDLCKSDAYATVRVDGATKFVFVKGDTLSLTKGE